MALARRGNQRFSATIWPGFVDAMTALLLVLMFVLTIFMVVQSVLRDTISTQDSELSVLSEQVAGLAQALSLEQVKTRTLTGDLDAARDAAAAQSSLIATLTGQLEAKGRDLAAAETRITSFEAQVATLLTERDAARSAAASAESARDIARSEAEALNLALASVRSEIDTAAEAARLAAARREALEALTADLRARADTAEGKLAAAQTQLSTAEATQLADAAALEALRERLKNADTEITAMTLSLEQSRKKAEETLTLLAAAEAAKRDLEASIGPGSEAERQAALLAVANAELAKQQATSAEAERRVALLNQQIAALRRQLGALQAVLDDSAARDAEAKVQVESLGTQLNAALAQVASEQRRRAELEEAAKLRAQEEARELTRYRSEFFGRLSAILAGREGVRVVGDRFVFSSEVLFQPGSANLSPEGRAQIADVVAMLRDVSDKIPPEIDWILRVDGHTDDVPLSGQGAFADNWELSQARALSVVRYMIDDLGFAPSRLAATGFGEFRPVAAGDTPEARAQNRRIELKLTER
ncbi:peptidoglycan -binding protein [Phaeovulum sp.]|uniref:peptidoglycan -binding protein n=1 Tax=Phaeovulum sp. TaxID=2934796 RepID=UPI0039E2FFE1